MKGIQNTLLEILHEQTPSTELESLQIKLEEQLMGYYSEERDYSYVKKNLSPWHDSRAFQLPY